MASGSSVVHGFLSHPTHMLKATALEQVREATCREQKNRKRRCGEEGRHIFMFKAPETCAGHLLCARQQGPRNDRGAVPELRELSASFKDTSEMLAPGHAAECGHGAESWEIWIAPSQVVE